MEKSDFIEFQKRRDFSDKLNITFAFTFQNLKSFLKALLFIAAPPVLVASMLMSSFMDDFVKLMTGFTRNPEVLSEYFSSPNLWMQAGVMVLFLLVGYVAVISTTYNFMILYQEKKSGDIEVSEVWGRVRDTLGMYISTSLLFIALTLVMYVVLLIPVFILGAISSFLVGFGFIFLFIAIMYVLVALSLVYPVRAFEKKNFFDAVSRSFKLIQGKWWSTFGLTMILSIVITIISYVFTLPASIIQGISMAHDVQAGSGFEEAGGSTRTLVFVLNSIGYIFNMMLYFLLTLGIAFQFFNLVELKESKGLLGKIGTLGEAPPAPPSEERY